MPRVYFGFDAQSVPGEHIFLSYSRGDAERIKGIALELHKMGLPIWYDDGLIPGHIWEDDLIENVKQSRLTVYFLTKELFRRKNTYMHKEYDYALDFLKPSLCIWLDDLRNMDCRQLPMDMYKWWSTIRNYQSIEVYHLNSDKQKVDEIFRGLCRADMRFAAYSTRRDKPTPESIYDSRRNYCVGDKISFGQYPQGVNGEFQPLEWRVLAVENGNALLITDKLIDSIEYNDLYVRVTWETSLLRKWLNNDFFVSAFNSYQMSKIVPVINSNPNNPEHNTYGGNRTKDRVFVLSIFEAEQYFKNDDERMAALGEYAKQHGACICDDLTAKHNYWNNSLKSGEKTGLWWLRSSGVVNNYCAYVYYNGFIVSDGEYCVANNIAVRPALWLNLN